MKKKKIIIYGFICMAILQLGGPVSMIVRRELTLRNGLQFKFKTAPVDPYDAFRGRYVALGMDIDFFQVKDDAKYTRGQEVYAVIEEGTNGFAQIKDLHLDDPKLPNCMKVKVGWVRHHNTNAEVRISFPFDRYYMNEKDAPLAERIYRRNSARSNRNAYVSVRVDSGFAILEELYIGEQSIGEFLRCETEK